jgi:N-acetylglucosaminyl-diphospho-decaprenol L-rhamnosyltransferase
MANVHVVVVNYNTVGLLRQCLDHAIASQTAAAISLTVVDNGSTDGSMAMLREDYPQVRALRSERNLGFSGGNNLALRQILAGLPQRAAREHEYILLVNTDLFLAPDTIAGLVRFAEGHPGVGAVGPRVERPDGTLDLACRRSFPTPANAFFKLFGLSRYFPGNARFASYNLTNLDPAQRTEVDAVTGACMLVRVSAIEQVGLLDERFFMYGEDLDWAYRIKARGWRIFYEPAVRATHRKGATSARQSGRMIVEFYRAMYLFHRKHYASRSPRPLNWLVAAGIAARGGAALGVNLLRPATKKRVAP